MKNQHEKMMADLQRLIAAQDFQSEEELQKFLDNLVGQTIPSFPKVLLSIEEQAQDLVFEASELSPAKAKSNIEKALQLNPDCIEAYEFLGNRERTAEMACIFFEKAVTIGRRVFGGKYFEEHEGKFWGFHETRPFMRCLQQYSECLYAMGKIEDCVSILEEMIVLNPNDNQGVRDQLLLYLIQINEGKKFRHYEKMYEEDRSAFALFNRALFAFKTEGESEISNALLKKALAQNKFVAKRLLSNKSITQLAGHYGYGDENEADYYASYATYIWAMTTGAKEWLKKKAAIA
jgi:tetratricopeptide (TPR) repeat protein